MRGRAAHILARVAVAEGREVFAFTRPGDAPAQAFARRLGCVWAGGSGARPPEALDVETHAALYPLRQANAALAALRAGTLTGAAVLTGADDASRAP